MGISRRIWQKHKTNHLKAQAHQTSYPHKNGMLTDCFNRKNKRYTQKTRLQHQQQSDKRKKKNEAVRKTEEFTGARDATS